MGSRRYQRAVGNYGQDSGDFRLQVGSVVGAAKSQAGSRGMIGRLRRPAGVGKVLTLPAVTPAVLDFAPMKTPGFTHGFAREVSRSLGRCELLYVPRQEFDLPLARRQHAAYIATLEAAGINITVLPEEPDLSAACTTSRHFSRKERITFVSLGPSVLRFVSMSLLPCQGKSFIQTNLTRLLCHVNMRTAAVCSALTELSTKGEVVRNARAYRLKLPFPALRTPNGTKAGNSDRTQGVSI